MDRIKITGGQRLQGTVEASGAKNASLPLMAASLLADTPSHLDRVPQLHDVTSMSKIIEHLGAIVTRTNGGLTIDPSCIYEAEAPYDLVRKMRASYYVLGPLLAKFRHARVSLPGGCLIGSRPIDLHLRGFEALGATISLEHGYIDAVAPREGLHGAEMSLEGPSGSSVGATCNVLMAASLARGRSIIRGASCEPHVDDLANYLNAMGAHIEGIGTNVLTVEGVASLQGANYQVIADQIEAGTLMVAAAMNKGDVVIQNCRPDHMRAEITKLQEMGAHLEVGETSIHVTNGSQLRPAAVRTLPYPGFPTDMQAQFMAAMCFAQGESTVVETIFPERFMHAAELVRMGADITVTNGTAKVRGVEKLQGAMVMASDLRASAALVLAGLAAEGETEILRVYHLDRGYEGLEQKFRTLGAKIERVSVNEATGETNPTE